MQVLEHSLGTLARTWWSSLLFSRDQRPARDGQVLLWSSPGRAHPRSHPEEYKCAAQEHLFRCLRTPAVAGRSARLLQRPTSPAHRKASRSKEFRCCWTPPGPSVESFTERRLYKGYLPTGARCRCSWCEWSLPQRWSRPCASDVAPGEWRFDAGGSLHIKPTGSKYTSVCDPRRQPIRRITHGRRGHIQTSSPCWTAWSAISRRWMR